MPTSRRLGLLVTVALVSACTSQSGPNAAAPVAAQLSVERFLQAANARDIDTMGRLFGTSEGPAADTGSTFGCFFKKIGSWFGGSSCVNRVDVEIRMDAIASIVRHDDYTIIREEQVAGRTSPTRRVLVNMDIGGRAVSSAPFVVVQTSEGRWLVEEVPLEIIMGR